MEAYWVEGYLAEVDADILETFLDLYRRLL